MHIVNFCITAVFDLQHIDEDLRLLFMGVQGIQYSGSQMWGFGAVKSSFLSLKKICQ